MEPATQSGLVFIGTYTGTGSKGIYVLSFDPATGALQDAGAIAEVVNPAFLALNSDGTRLYSVSETATTGNAKSGAVSAFVVDPRKGTMGFLNRQLSQGTSPCHLCLGLDGKALFTANYSSGTVTMLPILADGQLGEPCSSRQHEGKGPNAQRQEGPHAHSITPDPATGHLYACDLGLDRILIYRTETGQLVPAKPAALNTHPGAGPRHLAFHPGGRWLYVVNELDSTVSVFARKTAKGAFGTTEIQGVSTLPPGTTMTSWCADIHVHPNGRFVYASNRGHDSIAVSAVDPADGTLTAVGFDPVLGKTPRNFAVHPSGRWLLAASQDSDVIKVFALDERSGRLTYAGRTVAVPKPVCIRFAPTC